MPYGKRRLTICQQGFKKPRGARRQAPRRQHWLISRTSSRQLGVERYFGVEELGDRAVLLGFPRHPGERGLVQVRHVGAQNQSRAGDAKALAFRLQSDGRLGGKLGGSVAAALELKGKCHSETAGVCSGNEFLGVGTLLVLETRLERIRSLGEHTGIGG